MEEKQKIKTFTDLDTWKKGHRLVLIIYEVSKNFPKDKLFGLTSQIRRAAVSITSNIAEGFSRNSYLEKSHFYSISQGSNTEVQNQLILAKDVGYIETEKFEKIINQSLKVHKIINGLIKKSKSLHNS